MPPWPVFQVASCTRGEDTRCASPRAAARKRGRSESHFSPPAPGVRRVRSAAAGDLGGRFDVVLGCHRRSGDLSGSRWQGVPGVRERPQYPRRAADRRLSQPVRRLDAGPHAGRRLRRRGAAWRRGDFGRRRARTRRRDGRDGAGRERSRRSRNRDRFFGRLMQRSATLAQRALARLL